MPTKEILCLAKSRKNGKWCIAGVDYLGNWIRFVNTGGCELANIDIQDEKGNQPQLLETWEVEVLAREPLYFQPENWVIDQTKYWGTSNDPIYPDLDDFCDDDGLIFLNTADRLSTFSLMLDPISKSLMLIYLDEVTFQKTTNYQNHLQIRAIFEYRGHDYDFAVTDPDWEARFRGSNSEYPEFGFYKLTGGFYLTIGLGQEFKGYHYKLVVAVIPLDTVLVELTDWE